jgi:hypothetical protein
VIANQGSGQTVSGITQTGASWSKVVTSASSNSQAEVEIWKAENVSGASKTVAITLSGTPNYGAVANVLEYSGLATSSTDQTATKGATVQGTSANTGTTINPTTVPNELWLGGISSYGAATSLPLNGFTQIDGTLSGTNTVCSVLEKIVSTAGTAGSGVTCGNNWWAGCIATFKGT